MGWTIFAIAAAMAVCAGQVLKSVRFRRFVREWAAAHGATVTATPMAGGTMLQLWIPVALCAVFAAVVLLWPAAVKEPQEMLLLCVVLAIVFSAGGLTGGMHQRLHGTDDGFLWDGEMIRYANIRELRCPRGRVAEVVMRGGETHRITRGQHDALRAICLSRKLKVRIEQPVRTKLALPGWKK